MNIQEQVEAGFEKIKSMFVAKASDDLGKANQTITDLNKKVEDLNGQITKLQGELKAKDEQITKLQGEVKETKESVDKQANQRALAIEQQRGVTAPVGEEKGNESGGTQGAPLSKLEEYRALLVSNPRAAGDFFAK